MEGLKKKERVRTEGMKGERKERKVNKMGTQKRTKRKRTEQNGQEKKKGRWNAIILFGYYDHPTTVTSSISGRDGRWDPIFPRDAVRANTKMPLSKGYSMQLHLDGVRFSLHLSLTDRQSRTRNWRKPFAIKNDNNRIRPVAMRMCMQHRDTDIHNDPIRY